MRGQSRGQLRAMLRGLSPALLLSLSQGVVHAQTRPLDLLPGGIWMRASRPGVQLATARPLAGMPAAEHWIDLYGRTPASTAWRLRLRKLKAGSFAEEEAGGAVHWRAPWLELNVAVSVARLSIENFGETRRTDGGAALIVAHGALRAGVRAFASRAQPERTLLWEQALHLRSPHGTIALGRRASLYGSGAIWSFAAILPLSEPLAVGLRAQERELLLQLRARVLRLSFTLSQPMASPHGGGVAAGIGWFP